MSRRDEQIDLLARTQNGDAVARAELVTRNMGLVHRIAKTFRPPRYVERAELAQVGAVALLANVHRWNPAQGALSTFVGMIVWGAVQRFCARNASAVHVGVARSFAELVAVASADAYDDASHRRRDDARVALAAMRGVVALDATIGDGDGVTTRGDMLRDTSPPADDLYAECELAAIARGALAGRSRVPVRAMPRLRRALCDGARFDAVSAHAAHVLGTCLQ